MIRQVPVWPPLKVVNMRASKLGTGRGTSVKELVRVVEMISKKQLPIEFGPRREGDPPELIADNSQAIGRLGWKPHHDIDSIVGSAWNWHQRVGS